MPDNKFYNGFCWAVPISFCEPLAKCRFEEGDILYDNNIAYEGSWADALPYLRYNIQISYPPRGLFGDYSSEDNQFDLIDDTSIHVKTSGNKQFARNWYSTVVFQLTDYMENRSRQVITTQGRLYTLLWQGDMRSLSDDIAHPPVPSFMPSPLNKDGLSILRQAEEYFANDVSQRIDANMIFLMPYDHTNPILREKLSKVHAILQSLSPQVMFCSPAEAGIISTPSFVPTSRIVCFALSGCAEDELYNRLKSVLYTSAKHSTVDRFSIERHGYLSTIRSVIKSG